ncbi:hypothetical protein TVAG_148560 [Trichomonas vaginalis G3]|uniref:Uncharacterized protein n=1 Tax=Trichomonas vaginalis (strain ATCC PRA-98 / G3) TaxID=412133 RepID=A2FF00_TRIV3|nr:hypothetical protein TVAGG3_0661210 [Trichomonas vaginalis G3]EAX96504.1 hypothetical protein TVAG_148560 [Trichomonas vaginalis G3]KAI5506505.1 hypothetical protein TVAGG3_0661210 [Trichomonas vaginalis G3]|eukprot:XP_001309434.1 hypothetical protein [Trichomonas vaginalis G3]
MPDFKSMPKEDDLVHYIVTAKTTPNQSSIPALIQTDPYFKKTMEIVGVICGTLLLLSFVFCCIFNHHKDSHHDIDVLLITNKDVEEDTNDSVKTDLIESV